MADLTYEDIKSKDDTALKGMLEVTGFELYADHFLEQNIDGECLMEVTEAEFRDDMYMLPEDARFLVRCIQYWTDVNRRV